MELRRTSEWRFASPLGRQEAVWNLRNMYDRETTAEILGCTVSNVYYHERKTLKRKYHN